MPLTMCHPAASIPFRRMGFPLSALVLGSMMPDFEFFFRLDTGKDIGHTFHGIILFCVPVGLALLFIFHRLIKFPLLSLFPHKHHAMLIPVAQRFRFFPLTNFIKIIAALIIGVLTHIGWDAFTHPDSALVQVVPFLQTELFTIPQGTVRLYFFLQYAGSLLGAIMMVYWYVQWYRRNSLPRLNHLRLPLHHRLSIGASMGTFSLTGGLLYGYYSIPHFENVEMLKRFLTYSSIATVSGFLIAMITFGVLWHALIPHHKRKIVHHGDVSTLKLEM